MSEYLISLTPIGKYFFGGDMTFKVGDNNAHNARFSSYIIESNRFPQQTSLLGMLRYLILSNDNLSFDNEKKVIINKDNAQSLIGKNSFTINENFQQNDYGMIKSLSFCRLAITEKGKLAHFLLPTPKDYEYSVAFDSTKIATFNRKQISTPDIVGYNPKEYKEECFLGLENPLKSSAIFLQDNRVGIDKRYDGKSDNNEAFYKQKSYRFAQIDKDHSQYCFAFYAEINDKIDLSQSPYNGSIVSIGGDSSMFLFSATKAVEKEIAYSENYNGDKIFTTGCKIILLSDAYLERQEAEQAVFSLSETISFRFINTSVDTEKYTVLSGTNLRNGEKYYLYRKGSVFYCDQEQLAYMESALKKDCFTQIGYNHYQIIQNKK